MKLVSLDLCLEQIVGICWLCEVTICNNRGQEGLYLACSIVFDVRVGNFITGTQEHIPAMHIVGGEKFL